MQTADRILANGARETIALDQFRIGDVIDRGSEGARLVTYTVFRTLEGATPILGLGPAKMALLAVPLETIVVARFRVFGYSRWFGTDICPIEGAHMPVIGSRPLGELDVRAQPVRLLKHMIVQCVVYAQP
jgi:hypothetical protein